MQLNKVVVITILVNLVAVAALSVWGFLAIPLINTALDIFELLVIVVNLPAYLAGFGIRMFVPDTMTSLVACYVIWGLLITPQWLVYFWIGRRIRRRLSVQA